MPVILASSIADKACNLDSGECATFCSAYDLAASDVSGTINVFGPCSSALDVAAHLAAEGRLSVWDSVICSRQWAGRGQLRRHWVSEPGNVFAAWRLPVTPRQWDSLAPILLGWALSRAFEQTGVDLKVKWPNDLLVDDRKIGGMLLEERGEVLLAGIGINLRSSPDDALMRAEAACPASNLGSRLPDLTALGLWLQLVGRARFWYEHTLSTTAPQTFVQLIEPVMAYFGRRVVIADNRSSFSGVFDGLRPDGAIVLRTEGEHKVFHSGSLSPAGSQDEPF